MPYNFSPLKKLPSLKSVGIKIARKTEENNINNIMLNLCGPNVRINTSNKIP